jgi:acyl-CoA synthetase (AMP-forming)/AMP-acid ligase II
VTRDSRGAPTATNRASEGGAALFAAFEALRRERPTALAVQDFDRDVVLDRDALARRIDGAAAVLRGSDRGLARGARVGLQVPNSAELIAAVLACWREGWIPAPLDRELADVEVAAIRARLGLATVRRGIALAEVPLQDGLRQEPASGVAPLPVGTALLKLTSGSTGEPRGVALHAEALHAGATQILTTMGIGAGDRNLVTIPLTHSYGFDNVVLALALAGTAALLTADLTPLRLLQVARDGGATVLPSVPFLLDLLSRSSARSPLPALRLVISAGAPLPLETRERFSAGFGVRPRTFYGSTECGGITFDREGAAALPEGCVGSPLDGVSVDLLDAEEGAGRIAVRSPSVASSYVPPAATDPDPPLAAGRFVTPDVGRVDEQGRLHLLGRALDVINVGGRKVYPAEVERVIRSVPGVRDVVVLGIERSAVAAALRAIVEAGPEVARESIVRACEQGLARYKIPRSIELRAELPRTGRGKVDRRDLV